MSERTSRSFFLELLGARVLRRSHEAAHRDIRAAFPANRRAREAEVDDLDYELVFLVVLVGDHDVRRLDIAMNESLPRRGTQGAGNLKGDLKGISHPEGGILVLYQGFDGLAVDPLHCVEETLLVVSEMVDARDIAVAQSGGGARFAQEPGAGGLAVQVESVDDF